MNDLAAHLQQVDARLDGTIVAPWHTNYAEMRRVWNGMIDRRPAAIVRCASERDIALGIELARERGVPLAVRGGSHSVAGLATCDDGVVLDLRSLNAVTVDPVRRLVRAGGGTVLGDVDRANSAHGLVTPAGVVSHTGTGGLTLGGGVGWLTRKFGLTCDNILSARVVLANGDTVIASDDENPDLLWGLRGGGGNFGVVSEFTYRNHPFPPEVPVAWGFWPLRHAHAVLGAWGEQIHTQPEEWKATAYMTRGSEQFGIPSEFAGQPGVMILQVWANADIERAERAFRELVSAAPPGVWSVDWVRFVELQQREDELAAYGKGNYTKGGYLPHIDASIIDAMIDVALDLGTDELAMEALEVIPHGGAQLRLGEDDTAFPDREAAYSFNFTTRFPLDKPADPHVEWARRGHRRLHPLASHGEYTNFFAYDQGQDRVLAAYGDAKYRKLARLKSVYDPANIFRLNGNIRPARPREGESQGEHQLPENV